MKLLVYGINYAPEPTGIGKYTAEMATYLAARGHQVEVLTALPHYPAWKVDEAYQGKGYLSETIDGVQVHRAPLYVPPAHKLNSRKRIFLESSFTLTSLRYWLPRLFRKPYDAVICVCPPLQSAVLPWLYSHFRGVPWIFHIQDLQVDAALRLGMVSGQVSHYLYGLENFFIKHATYVTSISETMRQRAIQKGTTEAQSWLFPNWADTDFIRPLPRDNALRQGLGLSPDDTLVLYSGNMGKKQGLELVLAAAERFEAQPWVKFMLVGQGAARPSLEALAAEKGLKNVSFHDLYPWKDMPELLAAGDIHLIVQRREAADLVMPSKLTNVMAAGRVSLATADPDTSLAQVLCSHEAGLVVPPDDIESFTQALQALVDAPERCRYLGHNARHYAESYLSKDSVLLSFERRLQEVVAQSHTQEARAFAEDVLSDTSVR